MDGLGLVFEQQGNTGAAAYNAPALNSRMDRVADDINDVYKLQLHDKMYQDKVKAAALQKAYNPDIDWKSWHMGNQQELGKDMNAFRQRAAELKQAGVNPQDYGNPKSVEFAQAQMALENKAQTVKQQEADFIKYRDIVAQDVNSATPQFDSNASMQALTQWLNTPSVAERAKVDPAKLLVTKPKPFDTYSPIKDFNINPYVGSFGTDSPTGGSSGSTLNKANLKKDMQAVAQNPVNEEHFQQGVQRGLWKTKDEYGDVLYDKALRQYTPDYKKTVKEPKDGSGVGLTDDQVKAIIDTPPLKYNHARVSVNGNPEKTEKGDQVYKHTTVFNPQSLGPIKLIVPGAEAYNLSSGAKNKEAGNYELKDGQMGIGFMYSDGKGPVEDLEPGAKYRVKDKSGNTKLLTEQEMIDQGYAEYKPIIQGNGGYESDDNKNLEVPIVIEADKFINTVNGKSSKDMNDAYNKLKVLRQIATNKNTSASAQNKANANKVVPRAKVKSLVGTKGYEGYTEQELIDYYASQGYTIQ